MKKLLISLLIVSLVLSLAACGAGEKASPDTQGTPVPQNGQKAPEEQTASDRADTPVSPKAAEEPTAADAQAAPDEKTPPETQSAADSAPAELLPPVMEWWELYNPNGFDTLTAVISNPNDVPIDVTYDLVYCKSGEETARSEAFFNADILPGHRSIVWANYDIPKSADVDDVRLENVTVSESYYEPVDGKYEYVGITDGNACFDFTFERKPTLATITFLLYSDNNRNGQFDKGEIVVTSSASLTEQTGRVSFDTDVFSYTDYEVFFTAY